MKKQCSRCNKKKDTTEFHKSSKMKDGLQSACKMCMNDSYNISRKKKQQHYQDVAKKRAAKIKIEIDEWKEKRGCFNCREVDPACLDLHHLDPTIKEDHPSSLRFSFQSFVKEAEKCVVLCSNCHRKLHAGKINLPFA